MLQMGVIPDHDTLCYYCLPFFHLKDSQELLTKFQKLGVPTQNLIIPFLKVLLENKMINEAKKICKE